MSHPRVGRYLSAVFVITVATVVSVVAMVAMVATRSPRLIAQRGKEIKWVWSGGVSPAGVVIKARAVAPGVPLRLVVSPASGGGAPAYDRTIEADALGLATFAVDQLSPATLYNYAVTGSSARLEGSFKTFRDGPFPFRIAFAACARTGSASAIFREIRRLEPNLFIHMGDFHYENISTNEPDRFFQAYDAVLGSPAQAALFRALPIVYMWDDHDFGSNNSDATSPSRPAALQAYGTFVPHYPLTSTDTVQQAFSIGRVRVIVTDARAARSPMGGDPARRTMLGKAQLEWLERELEASQSAPLVLWVNSLPWITRGQERTTDGWAPYAVERERIANRIAALQLTDRLVMLSGDAHMVAIDDGSHSNYATTDPSRRGFVVAHAGPLDQRPKKKGGPYSSGESLNNGQFGLLDVTDDGTTLRAVITGRNDRGVIARMRLALVCTASRCQIDGAPAPD
jgi:phosphodiesterase/alkaline phosphatase D-like protein